jgi:hypothetical protein
VPPEDAQVISDMLSEWLGLDPASHFEECKEPEETAGWCLLVKLGRLNCLPDADLFLWAVHLCRPDLSMRTALGAALRLGFGLLLSIHETALAPFQALHPRKADDRGSFQEEDLDNRHLFISEYADGGPKLYAQYKRNLQTAFRTRPHLRRAMLEKGGLLAIIALTYRVETSVSPCAMAIPDGFWDGPSASVLYHHHARLLDSYHLADKLSDLEMRVVTGSFEARQRGQEGKSIWPSPARLEFHSLDMWEGHASSEYLDWFYAQLHSWEAGLSVRTHTDTQWAHAFASSAAAVRARNATTRKLRASPRWTQFQEGVHALSQQILSDGSDLQGLPNTLRPSLSALVG